MAAQAVTTQRRIIPRPRLTKLLDESPARIKLLVAPAGYGKTTLAQQWLDVSERRDVWYRGSPASADVAALAAGIAIAASEIVPDAGTRMRERLRVSQSPADDAEILAELFSDDVASWPKDAWLVIDDYQFAMDSAASERFVELFVQRTAVQVVLTSRLRPTWATARRILYGEVQEIERRQLAMEREEAMSVIGRDDENVAALVARAQGWPAVIGLAANRPSWIFPTRDSPRLFTSTSPKSCFSGLTPSFRSDSASFALPQSLRLGSCRSLLVKLMTFRSKAPSGSECSRSMRRHTRFTRSFGASWSQSCFLSTLMKWKVWPLALLTISSQSVRGMTPMKSSIVSGLLHG
jgi:hypothetical protein